MSKSDKGGVPEIRWGESFVREVGVEYTSTDTELFEWSFRDKEPRTSLGRVFSRMVEAEELPCEETRAAWRP